MKVHDSSKPFKYVPMEQQRQQRTLHQQSYADLRSYSQPQSTTIEAPIFPEGSVTLSSPQQHRRDLEMVPTDSNSLVSTRGIDGGYGTVTDGHLRTADATANITKSSYTKLQHESQTVYRGDVDNERGAKSLLVFSAQYQQPLSLGTGYYEEAAVSSLHCWSHITSDIAALLFIYMVNKAGQDLCLSSMPILTQRLFGWTSERSGYFMGVLGGMVLPCVVVGNIFTVDMQDRDALFWLSLVTLAASILVLNDASILSLNYTEIQYMLAVSLLYGMLNITEGVTMSLLSKLVSPALAQGTFNSAFLTSEAGTFGRVLGDVSITVMAVAAGKSANSADSTTSPSPFDLVNLFYLPLIVGLIVSIVLVYGLYDRLLV